MGFMREIFWDDQGNHLRSDSVMNNFRTFCPCMVFIAVLITSGCEPRSRAEVDRIIGRSETLTKIDRVCQSLRKPDGFVEVKKSLGGNSDHSTIEYQYKMSQSFDSVAEHFKNECEKIQCSLVGEYNNRNDRGFRTLNLRIEGVQIEVEYRSEFGSLVNYGCSM